jgi:hypothetical protein
MNSIRLTTNVGGAIYIRCRRLQSDCQCHVSRIPEAGVIRRQIPQALDNAFSELFRLLISAVLSACKYSRVVFLYAPQEVGRIRTFLQKTTSTTTAHGEAVSSSWRTRCGASRATQFPAVCTTVDESVVLGINKPRHAFILSYALLEVCVFCTRACFVSKCSFEFRHEATGEVEDRGQEKKMKLHC